MCVHTMMMKKQFGVLVFISQATYKFKLESFQNTIFTASVVRLRTGTSLKNPLPLIGLRIKVISLNGKLITVCSNLQHSRAQCLP